MYMHTGQPFVRVKQDDIHPKRETALIEDLLSTNRKELIQDLHICKHTKQIRLELCPARAGTLLRQYKTLYKALLSSSV